MARLTDFANAILGEEAYTWQYENPDVSEYAFETGDDPRGLYDETEHEPVLRKRWRLVEIVRLHDPEPEDEEEDG